MRPQGGGGERRIGLPRHRLIQPLHHPLHGVGGAHHHRRRGFVGGGRVFGIGQKRWGGENELLISLRGERHSSNIVPVERLHVCRIRLHADHHVVVVLRLRLLHQLRRL